MLHTVNPRLGKYHCFQVYSVLYNQHQQVKCSSHVFPAFIVLLSVLFSSHYVNVPLTFTSCYSYVHVHQLRAIRDALTEYHNKLSHGLSSPDGHSDSMHNPL